MLIHYYNTEVVAKMRILSKVDDQGPPLKYSKKYPEY